MTDSNPPGGWPWGKNKPGGGSTKGSDIASGAQQQVEKGVQEPELQKLESQGGDNESQVPIRSSKEDGGESQAPQSTARSAMRGPESVSGNKSVKYEDEQPVSVQAPGSSKGSNRSFSRTGKDPSVASDANEAAEGAQSTAESVTEKARSTKAGDEPEDEGKDLTEPAEGAVSQAGEQTGEATEGTKSEAASQGKSQTESQGKSQGGSRIGSFFSGAKNIVPSSFGGGSKSNANASEVPDSLRELQEQQSQGGENLTLPEGEENQTSTEETEEDTPDETPDVAQSETATWGHTTAKQTGQPRTDGFGEGEDFLDSEELRPDDSITHAADNSRLPPEVQTDAQTPRGEGQTEFTEGQTEGQTQGLTEGQTEGQTETAQSQVPTSQIPEGEELPEGVTEGQEGEQLPEGQYPQGEDQKTVLTDGTGYETNTTAEEAEIDYSVLKDCKVNKLGNVVNDKGQAIGRITSGIMQHLIGRKVDENGIIWNDSGKEIGRAEPIPDNELQDMLEAKPFESFEGNVIDGKGFVNWEGQAVGKVVEGDLKVLQGKSVDADGEVLDKYGNVIGKAERWEEEELPEEEPEAAVDMSILAGKRVNKAGNVVDGSGVIFGRVIDGDIKRMIGRMCNKNGEIVSESGDVLGHAELVSEGEREGSKEGIFAELSGLTVAKDGTVVTPGGDIVGRLVTGDPKMLAGRSVDEDGDVLDRNGNVLGHAERWEPEPEPEVEKEKGPLAGLHVNNDGNVVDKSGNIIAKLTSGDPHICAGKEIDDDGDVINSKGMTVGHVNLLSEIQEPEEEESEEAKAERLQKEQDKKLAIQMSVALEQCLDKIKPICKMITSKIEIEEGKPEDERDEEALVKEVRPLIEEGGNILREAHGVIRGLDPDGHIQANAKHKSGTRDASPEEYHLADVIKEVSHNTQPSQPHEENA